MMDPPLSHQIVDPVEACDALKHPLNLHDLLIRDHPLWLYHQICPFPYRYEWPSYYQDQFLSLHSLSHNGDFY